VSGSTGFTSARPFSRFQHLRRRVDARRDPDRREWTSSGSRTAQFPKTHSLAARWTDSRSLHTTDLLHRLYGSSSTGNSTLPSLVITFRMKWARRSNLRRMISLDRNPCFTERNRLSAKAYRLRLRATAESASPRARPLRHRASGLCHAARSSGQLDLPRQPLPGVPECLEASRRSVCAFSAPAWLGVGRPSIGYGRPGSCVTGFRDLATCAAWVDHDTVTTLDWCVD